MERMFYGADSFRQDITGWDIRNVTTMDGMFNTVSLPTAYYDMLLQGWAAQEVQPNVLFSGGDSHFCHGSAARADLVDNHGWTISDDGQNCTQYSFILRVQTNLTGTSSDTQFTIPTNAEAVYNYNVDCNADGNYEATGVTGDYTCQYGSAGTYSIAIMDNFGDRTGFPQIVFADGGDAQKVVSIEQWGENQWGSMEGAFSGCANLVGNASDTPDLSQVTNMYYMFYEAANFNQDIGDWDTSHVTDFQGAFRKAVSFNQDIGGWDTGSATTMQGMFRGASAFNQDIGGWDTGSVKNMVFMFDGAGAFDQNLGSWDVTALNDAHEMFTDAQLSTENYDALLNGWAAQDVKEGVLFGAGGSNYCDGEAARDSLINDHGWTITDTGRYCRLEHFVLKVNVYDMYGELTYTPYTSSEETYNYNVDCNNDGVPEVVGATGNYTCDYGETGLNTGPGEYTVRIIDNAGDGTGFPHLYYSGFIFDASKLLSVEQWGTMKWSSMEKAFFDCENLTVNATDSPDLSRVTNLSGMFYGTSFNQDISHWDVSGITDMSEMFRGTPFNQDISEWDVSGVTNMRWMFASTPFNQDISGWDVSNVTNMNGLFAISTFNQDISGWDTSNVTNMSYMFYGATDFNQDIGGWDTSQVISLNSMFDLATAFNQDIGGWDTSKVQYMWGVFANTPSFNQDISGWDTSQVGTFREMFYLATSFDQDLGGWDLSSATNMSKVFVNAPLSSTNYDSILIGWSSYDLPQNGSLTVAATYCLGSAGRDKLVNTYEWFLTDGGLQCLMTPTLRVRSSDSGVIASGGTDAVGDDPSKTVHLSYMVENMSDDYLLINGIQGFEMTNASNFSSTTQFPVFLLGYEKRSFDVSFTVTDTGEYAVEMGIQNNSITNPYVVNITGRRTGAVSVPVLSSPVDGDSVVDATPLLDWEDVNNASGYTVQYSDNASFNQPDGASVSESTFTVPTALAYGTYYWRVKATGEAPFADSAWSEPWMFTVSELAAPQARFPKNDYVITTGTTQFKWTEVNGATGYTLELYRPDGGLYDVFTLDLGGCTAGFCTYKPAYSFETEYGSWRWRVRAVGVDTPGPWSGDATFDYQQIAMIGLTSPADNVLLHSNVPTFVWEESAEGVYRYDLEVWALDGTPAVSASLAAGAVCADGVCSWKTDTPLGNGVFTWRVLAKKYPNTSGWTASEVFTVDSDFVYSAWTGLDAGNAFNAPVVKFPKNGYEITTGTSLFKWGPVDGATSYVMELYHPDGRWFDVWEIESDACDSTACQFKPTYKLDCEFGEWQWRVRAKNGDDVGSWSSYATLNYVQVDPLTLTSPVDGANTGTTPTFVWEDSAQNLFRYVVELWTADGTLVVAQSLAPAGICSDGVCSWTSTATLSAGEAYKWRLLGKKWPNQCGWTNMETFYVSD